jgi:AAA15 family ATPase/GTPase
MLSKVTIKNFKSIFDLTLDLSFSGTAPNSYKELDMLPFLEPTSQRKDRVVPIMNIYGANASGKSNIIKALFCFTQVLREGVKAIPQHLFSLNKIKKSGDETFIQLEFFIKKNKYKYLLSYHYFSVTQEKLLLNDKEMFEIKNTKSNFKNIAIKNYDEDNIKKKFEITCLSSQENKQIQIKPFLSSIETDLPSLNKHLNEVSQFLKENTVVFLNNTIIADNAIEFLAKSKNEKDINEAFSRISDFIKRLDIDIEKFKYEQMRYDLNKFKVNSK